jgi:methanogenic corrinoid protein MtbC1
VNNTPRTHAAWKKAYDAQELAKLMVELSVQLEVELNVATVNEAIAENKVHILEKELEKANNRIKRLEEGGDEAICALEYASRVRIWTEAKEAKP